jgi:hypothetical protein
MWHKAMKDRPIQVFIATFMKSQDPHFSTPKSNLKNGFIAKQVNLLLGGLSGSRQTCQGRSDASPGFDRLLINASQRLA